MSDIRLGPRLSILLGAVAVVWLIGQIVPPLQRIGDILLLFFLAWLIAFVLEPLVTIQERMRLPRALAVMIVYGLLLFGLAVLGIIFVPAVFDQLGQLRENLPHLVAQLPSEQDVTSFMVRLGLPATQFSDIYRPEALAQQLQSSAGGLLQTGLALATSAVNVFVSVVLLLIISFYFLLDGRQMVRDGLRLLPRERRHSVMVVLTQIAANFGGFLRGQVIQAAIFGIIVAVVMLLLRMEFVAVAALSSAALMLIPLIGPILALIPPLVVALFHPQSIVIAVVIVLTVLQLLLVNAVMPRILSGQLGMPPLLVFAAILLGLRLGGPLGAFFGIPIMGAVYGTASVLYARSRKSEEERQQEEHALPDV